MLYEIKCYGCSTLSTSDAMQMGIFLSPIPFAVKHNAGPTLSLTEILPRFLYRYNKLDYVCRVTDNYSSTIRPSDFVRVHTSCATRN